MAVLIMLLHTSDAEMGRGFQPVSKRGGQKRWEVRPATAALSIRTAPDDTDESEEESTTPTAREARIPDRLPCPPAPRKKPPPLLCSREGGGAAAKEFFCCPDDLEAVFARRREQPAK